MAKEDVAYAVITLSLFALASLIIVVETRPLWAKEELVQEGYLTDYAIISGYHVFTFDENLTITEDGWMWKTFPPLNTRVALFKRGNALIVREATKPTIA